MSCRCTPALLLEHEGHAPGCMYHRPSPQPATPEPAASVGASPTAPSEPPPATPRDGVSRVYTPPVLRAGELGPAAREGLARERAWLVEQVWLLADGTLLESEVLRDLRDRLNFYLGVVDPLREPATEPAPPEQLVDAPEPEPPAPPPPEPRSTTNAAVSVLTAPGLHGGVPWTTGSRPPIPPSAGMQDLAPGSLAGMRATGGPVMPTPPPAPRGFTRPTPRARPAGWPEYSNGCPHPDARLQRYASGSMCQDCGTEFPHYVPPS